jgi:putative ABC transport system permease protein
MTALAHRSVLGGPRNGGVAARRAVVRWAGRLLQREWRQQLLVVTLLTVAVAAAIGSITVASNTVPADNSDFGSANMVLSFDGSDPQKLQAGLDAARRTFGTLDIVGHRSVPVPGSVETVDYRSQAPGGVYTDNLLALRRGRYPSGLREVAVTDGVAESLRLEVGSSLALDGHRRTVVGIVENPRKLSDEFALISPASARPDSVNVFVGAGDESPSTNSFFTALGDRDQSRWAFAGQMTRGNDVSSTSEKLLEFSVATVFLALASLVAAAAFAVVAQRRLRQLGMLAAVGATQKNIRLVQLTNGALVGAIAAVIGTIVGLAIWIVFAPTLEKAADHRIDPLALPWGLIAAAGLLAVVGASAAAWWPARAIARLPVVLTLSGRPPRPRPARRSAFAAVALIAISIVCLTLSHRDRPLLVIAGLLAAILGTMLFGPLAIRAISTVAGPLPIALRLALRDLARYQARSGAALAAVTLALGIAATVVVIAAAEEAKKASEPPSLSDREVRVYLGPSDARELPPADASARIDQLTAGARQIASQLDHATILPLQKIVQAGVTPMVIGDVRLLPTIELLRTANGKRYEGQSQLFLATPAVLRYLGIDPATIRPGADFLLDRSVATNDLFVGGGPQREVPVTNVQRIEVVRHRHLFGAGTARAPANFITLNGLRRHGWKQVPGGWLVQSSRPLTSEQIADARDAAANAGLTIEVRRKNNPPTALMAIAIAAGAVLALAILAMTVGLIRGESAGDLRTLTAAGATSRIRRTLTATTAGALALLGALLGVAGAYVAMVAVYHDELDYLSDVPYLYLALVVVGVPLAAVAAGWLLAGREPPAIARAVIE